MEITGLEDFVASSIPTTTTTANKRPRLDLFPTLLLVLNNKTSSLLREKTINNLNINKLYYRLYRLNSHTGVHHASQICQVTKLVSLYGDDQLCIPIQLMPEYSVDGIQVIHIPSGHTEVIIPTYTEFYNPYNIEDIIQTTMEVDKQLLTDHPPSNLVDILLQATSTNKSVDGVKVIELEKPTKLKTISAPVKATVERNADKPYVINIASSSLFFYGIMFIDKYNWEQTICHLVSPSPAALDGIINNITLNISFHRLYASFLENLIISEKVNNKNPVSKIILPYTDENFFRFPVIHTNDLSYRDQTFQNLITSLWKNFTVNYVVEPKEQEQEKEIYTTYCKYAYHINCLLPEPHNVSPLWYLLLKHRYKFEQFIYLIYQLHDLDIAYLDILESEHIPFIVWRNNYNITFYLKNHYSLVDLEDVRQKLKQTYIYYQQIKDHLTAVKQLADLLENLDVLVIGYIKKHEIWFKHPLENSCDFHVIKLPDLSIKEATLIENVLYSSIIDTHV
jgi:hypothetical protein